MKETKSYFYYELNGYKVYIYKALKRSVKHYSYMVRIKIVNNVKDFSWYNGFIDTFDVDRPEVINEKELKETVEWVNSLITNKIKDFRFPIHEELDK